MRIKDKTVLDRMNAEPAEKVLSDLEAKHGSVTEAAEPKRSGIVWTDERGPVSRAKKRI